MIRSFNDKKTEIIFKRGRAKKLPPDIHKRAKRKLLLIDSANNLEDLKVLPGNRLKRLSGDLVNKWSIRINQQWRICFEWKDGDAYKVEILDYH